MNLWRYLESIGGGRATPAEKGGNTPPNSTPIFIPRTDRVLKVASIVARIVLDARMYFLSAILVASLMPGRRGDYITAVLVAIGALLVYRADRLHRIPEHLNWLSWADLNKPLLRRLSLEAPGTYAHTIAIANLCEAACNAIGADGLLGRVGAYYHDIGKLRKPHHFVENQLRGRGNPHDKLKPSTSATIIRNHVREGIDLAESNHVPREIRAFIAEHHGTLPIAFFLQKARERDGTVNAAEYSYPGPIPQSAETAVCMLADGVEAKVRSLPDPTPAAIGEAVDAIIQRRLEEGQLRDAPITLRQLGIVRDQFVRILTGMHHGRIEYPTSTGTTLTISPSGTPPTPPSPTSRASA
jgi:putative nucleotidyltransferase with HDIG domain